MNIRGLSDSNGSGGEDMSCGDRMKAIWSQVPLFVRFMTSAILFFYLLSWFFTDEVLLLANIPILTIGQYHLWSIFTSVFIAGSLLRLIFGFMAWTPDAIRFEKERGTIKYMLGFFFNSSLIQLFFIAFSYLIGLKLSQVKFYPSAGLWPVILFDITLVCLDDPDASMRMFFIPCPIKARFYPWVLFLFFTLISQFRIQFDVLAAIFYGYFYFFCLKSKCYISDDFSLKVQNCCMFKYFQSFAGKYIKF